LRVTEQQDELHSLSEQVGREGKPRQGQHSLAGPEPDCSRCAMLRVWVSPRKVDGAFLFDAIGTRPVGF